MNKLLIISTALLVVFMAIITAQFATVANELKQPQTYRTGLKTSTTNIQPAATFRELQN